MNEQDQQPTPERDHELVPRVYVASLSDYNAGVLHGTWLDPAVEPEELLGEIGTMLKRSPTDRGEEWAIHDYEGFGSIRLGEYESAKRLTALARGVIEHGPAFAAWAEDTNVSTEDLSTFEEVYRGEWPSMEAYAEEVLTDLGAYEAIDNLGEWFAPYVRIDTEAFARDIGMDMNVVETSDGRVFVFDPS